MRTHTKRRSAAVKEEETSEQVDLTSESTAPTELEAVTSSAAEATLPTAYLSAEQKTLQKQFDKQMASERKSKAKKKKGHINKTTFKSPALN